MNLEIAITDINAGNNKDPIFKLDYSSRLDQYKVKAQAQLTRKYSDFAWLMSELQSTHPECIIPYLASIKAVYSLTCLTAVAMDEKAKETVQKFVDKLISHPALVKSAVLQQFLESGHSFAPVSSSTGSSTGGGKISGMSSFFKSVAKSVTSTKEIDPWFETHKLDNNTVLTIFDRSYKASDKVAKSRRALGSAMVDSAAKFMDLGACETSSSLGNSFRKFGAVFEKGGNEYAVQSELDILQASEPFSALSKYCENAEKTFDGRSALLGDYENACKKSLAKKQACEKLKTSSQVRHDKAEAAMAELTEAQTAEKDTKDLLQKVSNDIRDAEWPHLVNVIHEDVFAVLAGYARGQMDIEARILNEFQSLLPEFNALTAVTSQVTTPTAPGKIAAEVL
eukprot:Partr_v1_DN27663_c0_g1_i1_m64824 putative sorting nexin